MKIFLIISLFTVLAIGCKKDEPAVPGQQQYVDTVDRSKPPEPPGDTLLPPHARRAVGLFDLKTLRTHASAAKAYINLPDSALPVPIPPSTRPFKNLKLRDSNQNTVFYNFTTADGGRGEMVLIRVGYKADTIWIPAHILPM
jgi:hypothetical protein